MCYFAQMQSVSHYYKVIMRHAYCIDTEYSIQTLLVKSV